MLDSCWVLDMVPLKVKSWLPKFLLHGGDSDLSPWDLNYILNMDLLFLNCVILTSLPKDFYNWFTDMVPLKMYWMKECKGIYSKERLTMVAWPLGSLGPILYASLSSCCPQRWKCLLKKAQPRHYLEDDTLQVWGTISQDILYTLNQWLICAMFLEGRLVSLPN